MIEMVDAVDDGDEVEVWTPIESAFEAVLCAMEMVPNSYYAGTSHQAFGRVLDALYAWRELVAKDEGRVLCVREQGSFH